MPMNKIEKLIKELCPNGVEWKKLGEVFEMRNGYTPSKANPNFWINGDIPWFRMEDIRERGRILSDSFLHITSEAIKGKGLFKANSFILATTATIGEHALLIADSLANQRFTNLKICKSLEDKLSVKFMFYYMDIVDEFCKEHTNKSGFESVDMQALKNLPIPLPPLPIQTEIVRILDKFVEQQEQLERLIELRKKQYEYYREEMLKPKEGEVWETKRLGEICSDLYSGATPSTKIEKYWQDGTIPWMSSGEVNKGIVNKVDAFITQAGYDSCSTKMVPVGSVVIALAGQGKTRGTVALTQTELCTNQSLCALVPNLEITSGKYIFYYLRTQYSNLREVSAGDGNRGGLNLKMLREYEINIPSLKIQNLIVSKLDSFESSITALTLALETSKRRYEYYRDEMMRF